MKLFAIYQTYVVKALRGETDTDNDNLKFVQNLHEERSNALLFNSTYTFKFFRDQLSQSEGRDGNSVH